MTPAHLLGSQALLLLSPAIADLADHERHAIAAARAAGIRHIVKLSAWQANPASPILIVRQHGEAEQVLQTSGVPFTIVQGQYFLDNLLGSAPAVIATSRLALPFGTSVCAPIAAADFGEALARILLDGPNAHAGRTYQLTGPSLVSFADVAQAIGAATGQPVTYEPVLAAPFRRQLIDWGVPVWLAEELGDIFVSMAGGDSARITTDVHAILGRAPQSVAAFLAAHRTRFQPLRPTDGHSTEA